MGDDCARLSIYQKLSKFCGTDAETAKPSADAGAGNTCGTSYHLYSQSVSSYVEQILLQNFLVLSIVKYAQKHEIILIKSLFIM